VGVESDTDGEVINISAAGAGAMLVVVGAVVDDVVVVVVVIGGEEVVRDGLVADITQEDGSFNWLKRIGNA
jgi:hypothetical protein